MLKRQKYYQTVLHFRQWTNRAYAVLASLKHEVVISVLNCSITSTLGDKSSQMADTVAELLMMSTEADEDEACFEEMILQPVAVSPEGVAMHNFYIQDKPVYC